MDLTNCIEQKFLPPLHRSLELLARLDQAAEQSNRGTARFRGLDEGANACSRRARGRSPLCFLFWMGN
jgi:hypothetical protein